MANNLDSNVTRKLARVFLEKAESNRVVTKTVDTQLLAGKFNPSSGSTVDFKRPHDYNTISTAGGDISSSTKSDIIAGKATGTVQNYITVATEWGNLEEAIELDQLDQILAPMATRMITQLELDMGAYMIKNSSLKFGSHGTAVDAWTDVAGAGALMDSMGVMGEKCYLMNPYTETTLAATQYGLSGSDAMIKSAWENAVVRPNFAGMSVMRSNALKTFTSSDGADRAGTLSSAPDATYLTAKDTMTQTLPVTALQANMVVKAGDMVTVANVNRVSLGTRELILDGAGNTVPWTGVVVEDVTLNGSGAGNLVVAGPAIYEANGQYNTVDAAPSNGAVVTIISASDTVYQPNLFYAKQAFGLGTVKLPKLYATDTIATAEDGFSIRVSKYADGDANTQKVRFDLVPAFATFNPFFAGQGYGA